MKRTWEFEVDVPGIVTREAELLALSILNKAMEDHAALFDEEEVATDDTQNVATYVGVVEVDSAIEPVQMHNLMMTAVNREIASRWRDITERPWDIEFYQNSTPYFTRGHWELNWEDVGEKRDMEDPDSMPLYRASLHYDGQPCAKGSYCTEAPAWTTHDVLGKISDLLFDKLPAELPKEAFMGSEWHFPYTRMQDWTHQTDIPQPHWKKP